jgi:hypothetical protein
MPQKRPKLTLPSTLLQSHTAPLQPPSFSHVSHIRIPSPAPKNVAPATPRRVVTFSDVPEVIAGATFSPSESEGESAVTSGGGWSPWSPDDPLEDEGGPAKVYSMRKDWWESMERGIRDRGLVTRGNTDEGKDASCDASPAGGQGLQRAAMSTTLVGRGVRT